MVPSCCVPRELKSLCKFKTSLVVSFQQTSQLTNSAVSNTGTILGQSLTASHVISTSTKSLKQRRRRRQDTFKGRRLLISALVVSLWLNLVSNPTLAGKRTLFCQAWTRSISTQLRKRHQWRKYDLDTTLFVASRPLSANNFTPHFEKQNAKSNGKPKRRPGNTPKKVSQNTAGQNRSNQAAYQFNKVLQSMLQSTNGRPSTRETVDHAQDLLLSHVYSYNQKQEKLSGNSKRSIPLNENEEPGYDTVSFNIVMQAWARQHSMEAAQAADRLLRLLCQETPLQADSYSYAAVLHAYAKSGGQRPAALRATELLQEFLCLPSSSSSPSSSTATGSSRTDVCHNAVMDAWAASGDDRSGQRAEQILLQLEQDPQRRSTRVSYNACIKAYARSGQPEEAQRILDQMKLLAQKGRVDLAPDKVSISTCMHAWAKSTKDLSLAAQRADSLLCEMEECFERTGNEDLRPDIVAYSSVLSAIAKSGGNASVPLDLVERMDRYGKERPNSAFLNTWIHLLAKSSEIEKAVSSAETILEYMTAEYAAGKQDLKPCKVTYTAVITALAQQRTVAAAERAEDLLDELVELWRSTQDSSYLPSDKTFASVLNCWSKSGVEDGIQRAEDLLDRMNALYDKTQSQELRPNLIVYMQVFQILARSRSPQAGSKAKDILQQMNTLYLKGNENVRPDATTMAYFINTLTKSGVENVVQLATHIVNEVEEGYQAGMGHLKPTSLLYSAALQAYAKSASEEGVKLAESLLERTKALYRKGKMYAKPTVLFYNAVMDAHARCGGGSASAERAEELLKEMEAKSRAGDASLKPTTRSFNAAILAWKNSDVVEAPYRAEALLKRMNDLYRSGDQSCRPDRVTLNSIIAVWAKSSDPDGPRRAAGFLEFMESLYHKGEESFCPDHYTFNTCIDAYARHGDCVGAQRLYERMVMLGRKDPSLEPSIITLTSLQRAWKNSQSDETEGSHSKRIEES